jgi:hypothetical protein
VVTVAACIREMSSPNLIRIIVILTEISWFSSVCQCQCWVVLCNRPRSRAP